MLWVWNVFPQSMYTFLKYIFQSVFFQSVFFFKLYFLNCIFQTVFLQTELFQTVFFEVYQALRVYLHSFVLTLTPQMGAWFKA